MSIITKNQIIAGAVARGWCHKPNEQKTMDVDLAIAITDEVSKVAAPKQDLQPVTIRCTQQKHVTITL